MLLQWMGVKWWVCQQSLGCSCFPKEARSLGMAQPCEADALNAKEDSTGSSKKTKKAKPVSGGCWSVTDAREIKIEVNDLKFPLAFA